jgi:class 3 adenylate cyclase/HAMP domain-containing protein/sugar lactone lactonase YvrE
MLGLSIVVFIVVFGIRLSRNDFVKAVGFKDFDFAGVSVALKDSDGNRYVIDNGTKRILKIDSENTLLYILFGGKKSAGSFNRAEGIAVDHSGNLYVINRVSDEFGFYTIRDEIVRYTKNGKYDRVIFQKVYGEKDARPQLVQRSGIASIFCIGDNIVWYSATDEGLNAYTFNIATEKITDRQVMAYADANIHISSVAYDGENSLLYVNKIGEIYRYSPENGEELLYKDVSALPFALAQFANGNVYFTDILNKAIMKISGDGEIINLLDGGQSNKFGISVHEVYYTLSISNEETLLIINNGQYVIELSNTGEIQYIEKGVSVPLSFHIRVGGYYLILLLSVLLFLFFLKFFYYSVLNKKVSMIVKQVIIYIPIIILAIVLTLLIIYNDLQKRYTILLKEKIASKLQTISLSINGDDVNNVQSHLDYMNDSYKNLKESIIRLLNYNRDPWNNSFYFALHKKFDDNIYTIMFLNDETTARHPYSYLNDPEDIYIQAIEAGTILIDHSTDAWGIWFYGVAPLFDSDGNIAGLLEIGKDNVAFEEANKSLLDRVIENIALIALFMAALLSGVSYFMLKTLRRLKEGAARIAGGEYDIFIPAKGNDELAALTRSFNTMAQSVNTFINDITSLNKAYHRFVPEEFLKFLNKGSIKEIELGDQVEKEMTVMFSDIIGFTSISEKLTPEENFNFINSYLSLVGPSVRKNAGFIDKYIGDSIMALYPDAADDAVKTAIDILDLLNDFNKTRITVYGHPPIGVGFGIHTGRLMLGILGEKERVDSTVISDNVNLAARLEGLTRKFAASIIISSDTHERLSRKDMYIFRNLGVAKVKGKGESVRIYEVLDGLNAPDRKDRIKYLDAFENGVAAYEGLDFAKAHSIFSAIMQKCPSDSVALEFYMKMSKRAYKEKFSEGVLLLTDK